jgi:hypothetical protein
MTAPARYEADGAALVPACGWTTEHEADLTAEEADRMQALCGFGLVESAMARAFGKRPPQMARA